ncbi:hypothetical protein [Ferruginibacter albus]|uniref:hypothetical protein n=1 Tax=Ferruginibacter albus TaxID=2875540 RepID=UPI001CC581E7|nr:hypothetical protein [Ferruginibacter albus]UAY52750.1 hypothetical protein K9M53_03430 [Ferruginibacter albus]
MADKSIDISFNDLQNHEVQPPAEYFTEIWNSVSANDVPENSFSSRDTEIFNSLKDYSLIPPAFDSINIFENKAPQKSKVVSFSYFTKIAAAVIIVIFSAWLLYYFLQPKKTQSSVATVTAPQPAETKASTASPVETTIDKKSPTTINQSLVTVNNTPVQHSSASLAPIKSTLKKERTTLVDNDVILTLVSYKYADYSGLLAKIKKNKKIKLDNFSYVTVSDKMNAMLKDMYSTKRNLKPTRKAKKIKRTLNNWKKEDEKYFDAARSSKNPVDIIDLSEFVLSNR